MHLRGLNVYFGIAKGGSCIACIHQDSISSTACLKLIQEKNSLQRNFNFSRQRHSFRPFCHCTDVSSVGSHSILQSSAFNHWFKNWQELRRNKLTASTFGGAIGFWPHRRVQLWHEKVGFRAPFSKNVALCWSNIMEEVALERYKLITGNFVSFPEFQPYNKTSPEEDWLAASPDGLVEHMAYGLPFGGILEVKCPYFGGEARSLPWKRVPIYYMPQAQGLMEISNRDWMDFYCWTRNGSSLFRIYRDQEYWKLVKLALSDFWWKHVQPAKILLHENPFVDKVEVVDLYVPKSRHELYLDIVRASQILVNNSKLLVREIHGKFQD